MYRNNPPFRVVRFVAPSLKMLLMNESGSKPRNLMSVFDIIIIRLNKHIVWELNFHSRPPQIPSQNRIRCLQKRNAMEKSMGKTISQPINRECGRNFKLPLLRKLRKCLLLKSVFFSTKLLNFLEQGIIRISCKAQRLICWNFII